MPPKAFHESAEQFAIDNPDDKLDVAAWPGATFKCLLCYPSGDVNLEMGGATSRVLKRHCGGKKHKAMKHLFVVGDSETVSTGADGRLKDFTEWLKTEVGDKIVNGLEMEYDEEFADGFRELRVSDESAVKNTESDIYTIHHNLFPDN